MGVGMIHSPHLTVKETEAQKGGRDLPKVSQPVKWQNQDSIPGLPETRGRDLSPNLYPASPRSHPKIPTPTSLERS